MPEIVPRQKLTIYLIKDGREPNEMIGERGDVTKREVIVGAGPKGALYIKEGEPRPPQWARFFLEQVPERAFGEVSSSAAVLFAKASGRWFAVTFGHGRYLLPAESWEERFGLRVALNSIEPDSLRSIDKTIFEGSSRHSREQSSRKMSASDFGLDIERDLVRGVTGVPRQPRDLGGLLTGMGPLITHVRVRLGELGQLLELYHKKSLEGTYRKDFPWVDHIAQISDSVLVGQLDGEVIKMIKAKQFRRCWLAAPEILDWSVIGGFRYSRLPRATEHYDLDLKDLVAELRDVPALDKPRLTSKKIICVGDDGRELDTWSIYQCLYCELDLDGKSFILTGGAWYQVAQDYVAEVNEFFEHKIPRYKGRLPDYDDDKEADYNKRVVRQSAGQFALMDRVMVKCAGMASPIEFCDILSRGRDLFHVKRYGGSDVLSHLFAQGTVSGDLFLQDEAFRIALNEKLPPGFRLRSPNKRPTPEDFKITFAIVSKSPGDLDLPFFSRVSARLAVRRLQGYGYKVALAKVSVADGRKLKRKVQRVRRIPAPAARA